MNEDEPEPRLAVEEPKLFGKHMSDLIMRSLSARYANDPEQHELSTLRSNVWDLAYAFDFGANEPARRFRAYRILIARFGAGGARYLINLTVPIAASGLILTVRHRGTKELTSDGRKARTKLNREIADSKLARCVHRHKQSGLRGDEAITAALAELDKVTMGLEGAKRGLGRAKKAAIERGYVDPMDFDVLDRPGTHAAVEMLVRDFADRGRPRKSEK